MNVVIPIEGTTRRVQLDIHKCDITLENVDALVAFRVENGLTAGKSLTFLQAAEVEEEYQRKAKTCEHGVVKTGAGNLASEHRKCILHIQESHDVATFKDSVIATLQIAEKEQFHSVAFSPLIYLDDNRKAKAMAKGLFKGIVDFIKTDQPVSLNSILVCDHRVKYVQFLARDPGLPANLSLLQVASVTYKRQDPHLHDLAKKVLCDNCVIASIAEKVENENNNEPMSPTSPPPNGTEVLANGSNGIEH